MRVISGLVRGTKLKTIEELSTRPTLDRVKESLFNIIQKNIKNSVVLDLFAGSGALGIEALSRGASKAYFCDLNKEAIKVIMDNLNKTRLIEKATIIHCDYNEAIRKIKEKCDIIFLDPPYKLDLAVISVKIILKEQILSKNGIIIIETDEFKRDMEELEKIKNIQIVDNRKYGRANLIFIKERGN